MRRRERAAAPPAHDLPRLYDGYTRWKGWQGEFEAGDRDARYFAAELDGIDLSGKRVLEIGFGNGNFLAWARSRNAEVIGTEIIDALVAQACNKGYDARAASLLTLLASGQQFDLVVAFDVFEHWPKDELVANLRLLHTLLARDGLLLARFPNGHSPFGRVYQHGDLTHVTALSSSSIAQLALMTGFSVERLGNARRVPARRGLWTVLKHHWRRFRRARIEIALGKLYGFGRLPLDPNLSALLRKVDKVRGIEPPTRKEMTQ
ncbi:MAG TPA: class I SAM-dependent methyltransferase [Rudaea sp.]|jgi:2-polyprenyl-3-methyl-5-hydroxy-6-metoxy-1,4-benzoquinol methylase